jgi:hypothetical protein
LPNIRDDTFGYILHPVDLATNKIAAVYGRRGSVGEPPGHPPDGRRYWARAGKALGFTPEGIINEIRRMAATAPRTFHARQATRRSTPPALCAACGRFSKPDPDCLDDYETHAGHKRGQRPPARKSPQRCQSYRQKGWEKSP